MTQRHGSYISTAENWKFSQNIQGCIFQNECFQKRPKYRRNYLYVKKQCSIGSQIKCRGIFPTYATPNPLETKCSCWFYLALFQALTISDILSKQSHKINQPIRSGFLCINKETTLLAACSWFIVGSYFSLLFAFVSPPENVQWW